jgi:hypothetical protein
LRRNFIWHGNFFCVGSGSGKDLRFASEFWKDLTNRVRPRFVFCVLCFLFCVGILEGPNKSGPATICVLRFVFSILCFAFSFASSPKCFCVGSENLFCVGSDLDLRQWKSVLGSRETDAIFFKTQNAKRNCVQTRVQGQLLPLENGKE